MTPKLVWFLFVLYWVYHEQCQARLSPCSWQRLIPPEGSLLLQGSPRANDPEVSDDLRRRGQPGQVMGDVAKTHPPTLCICLPASFPSPHVVGWRVLRGVLTVIMPQPHAGEVVSWIAQVTYFEDRLVWAQYKEFPNLDSHLTIHINAKKAPRVFLMVCWIQGGTEMSQKLSVLRSPQWRRKQCKALLGWKRKAWGG